MIIFRSLSRSSFTKSGVMSAPHPAVYRIISDTHSYSNFIPWCNSSRIVRNISPTHNQTELAISFRNFRSLKYVSDVYLSHTDSESTIHSVCQ